MNCALHHILGCISFPFNYLAEGITMQPLYFYITR